MRGEAMYRIEDLKDGKYQVEVLLEGGSGRATITSPTEMTVEEEQATIKIVWSSPNYDYMIVEGEKYYSLANEENAVFEIPISVMDEPIPVIANTTAMSVPHEVSYSISVEATSLKEDKQGSVLTVFLILVFLGIAIGTILRKKKGKKNEDI